MPTVLLITERARVRQLFTELEQEGLFRLRVAPTLAQGEEEIALRLPDYVFVHDQISGLAGGVTIGYLRSLLPETAELFLMVRNTAEADALHEAAGLLDLSESDAELQRSLRDAIPRGAPRQNQAPSATSPATPKTARELLFFEPVREGAASRSRRPLWLVPLALAILSLPVIAHQAGKRTPPAPGEKTAAAPQFQVARAERISALHTAATRTAVNQSVKTIPVQTGETAAPSESYRHYDVQPGDNLSRVLVRDFGYSRTEIGGLVPRVKRLNKLSDLNLLLPGQRLIIPAAR